jgi:hypothetical protein
MHVSQGSDKAARRAPVTAWPCRQGLEGDLKTVANNDHFTMGSGNFDVKNVRKQACGPA